MISLFLVVVVVVVVVCVCVCVLFYKDFTVLNWEVSLFLSQLVFVNIKQFFFLSHSTNIADPSLIIIRKIIIRNIKNFAIF